MLKINGINKTFNNKNILNDINLEANIGDYICIIGKSGCGKTTLLNIIAGMMPPTNGNVLLDNVDIFSLSENKRTKLRTNKIGYLNCGNCLLENLTVYENLKYALLLNKLPFDKNKIKELLTKLDIYNIRNSYPSQISAGEYKRVCFGRILIMDQDILILDEPTSNLDEKSADIIIDIINEIKNKKIIIIATHDPKLMMGNVIRIGGDNGKS